MRVPGFISRPRDSLCARCSTRWVSRFRRRVISLAFLSVGLVGCSVTSTSASVPGMMGGSPASGMMGGSGSMMGDGTYHYAPLACSAPDGLPGTTVAVMLGDMGMTQMMAGTAPMGARMMLRSSLISAPAGQVSFVASNMGWRTHQLVIVPVADAQQAGTRAPAPMARSTRPPAWAELRLRAVPGPGWHHPGQHWPGQRGAPMGAMGCGATSRTTTPTVGGSSSTSAERDDAPSDSVLGKFRQRASASVTHRGCRSRRGRLRSPPQVGTRPGRVTS